MVSDLSLCIKKSTPTVHQEWILSFVGIGHHSPRMTKTANVLPIILRETEKNSLTYQEFLQKLLMHELKRREEKNIEK
jgi:hypothetical protein